MSSSIKENICVRRLLRFAAWLAFVVLFSMSMPGTHGAEGVSVNPTIAQPPEGMQLFLLIGQSNMAGRGRVEPRDKISHPRIFMLTKELAWSPATDPLHFDKPKVVGVGLGSSFARTLAESDPTMVVGLIPAAFGGTTLDDWKPDGPLYSAAVERVRVALQRGRLAGILWHQGEGDSAPDKAATYAARFAAMIARLRRDLNAPDVPVIVGETGRFRGSSEAINAVLAALPQTVPQSACVSAEGLHDKGDKTHFDSASQREFGRRYAHAWEVLVRSRATPSPVVRP